VVAAAALVVELLLAELPQAVANSAPATRTAGRTFDTGFLLGVVFSTSPPDATPLRFLPAEVRNYDAW
jgi:hypothetical protein